jgi:hypothetical protein
VIRQMWEDDLAELRDLAEAEERGRRRR